MSWKCDICDTYNEETATRCYVCDQPRSAESVREGLLLARKEKMERLNDAICKNAYGIFRMVFISGLAIALVAIVAAVIIKIVNSQLGDIWHLLFVLALRAWGHLSEGFADNLLTVLHRMATEPWEHLWYHSIALWEVAASNLACFATVAAEGVFVTVKHNLSDGYVFGIKPFGEKLSAHFAVLRSALGELWRRAWSSVQALSGR